MAGSRGYTNYRHQADIFHMYQILKERGFDRNHIITIAYNDIVYNRENPFKGQVFSTADHINRYPGDDVIDYQGKEANGQNFIRVLLGDTRNGRALQTDSKDDIFIYYDDHGAPGLLCVPTNNGPEIYADQIQKTFQRMHDEKRYNNIFFVVEACFSGSIACDFTIPGLFILTAAGPHQSSFSADWDPTIGSCRSNEFSKQFRLFILTHPDAPIIDLVNAAAIGTFKSHVSAYGDFKVSTRPLSDFLLSAKPMKLSEMDSSYFTPEFSNSNLPPNGGDKNQTKPIDMRVKNTFITFLEQRIKTATGEEKAKLEKLLESEKSRRKLSKQVINGIARKVQPNGGAEGPIEPTDILFDCYRTVVEGFRLFCGEIDEYELHRLSIFGHLCKTSPTEEILSQVRLSCPQKLWTVDQLNFQ